MKREAGWGAAALVVAAAFVGVSSQLGSKPPTDAAASGRSEGRTASASTKPGTLEGGPCVDLEGTLQKFLLSPPKGIAAPASCYAGGVAGQKNPADEEMRKSAGDMRFVIAILPDPVHTHFSLNFDRLAESIQQGVQDDGYFYDSSWLPWEKQEPPAGSVADRDIEEMRTRAREAQPGVLLFRKKPSRGDGGAAADAEEPYREGLAVFIVGEEPTTGIHKEQFQNAIEWITALQPQSGGSPIAPAHGVSILGPGFSGSLPSLAQLLFHNQDAVNSFAKNAPGGKLMIFSGSVSSLNLVRWFVRLPLIRDKVIFRSFSANGDLLLNRYRSYLQSQQFDLSHLAILSEDETAYGGYLDTSRPQNPGKVAPRQITNPPHSDPCAPPEKDKQGPACLYYPRDISALRDAYQKQSIFTSKTDQQSSDTTQKILTTDLADPTGRQHDTIRNYSSEQTALSQEAVLQQIVSMLKAHESQYIVLRSSNPLDQLFLSHYLRLTYPEGRVVIVGSDLLLRRESGASTLSGIMTLTTYPLLPWEHHWTGLGGKLNEHSHRVFADDIAESNYVATRFTIHSECIARSPDPIDVDGIEETRFLPANCTGVPIPNYAPPFWAQPTENKSNPQDPAWGWQRPAVWLSVLGRDGFWPVAALDEKSMPKNPPSMPDRVGHALVSLPNDLKFLFAHGESPSGQDEAGGPAYLPEHGRWPPMPLSMKLCLLAMLIWACFHIHCCMRPSLTVKPGHRAHFVRLQGWSHLVLMLLGSVIVGLLPILFAWGYGAMSPFGEPLAHAWWYRTFLPVTWLMAGLALALNVQVESVYGTPFPVKPWKFGPPWLPLLAGVLAVYVGLTYVIYGIVDFALDETLFPANRIPTYWRSINLTTGVSPLVPLIALAVGLYLWFWHSLQGIALFGPDRPLLPIEDDLKIHVGPGKDPLRPLCVFSREQTAQPIEDLCHPFSREILLVAGALFPIIFIAAAELAGGVPVRSLGSRAYSVLYCLGMDLCISLMLANVWQLLRIWLRLRLLLLFLDRVPMRRTMKAIKGYSWGSVWKMGGNVLDVRYKLLSRQFECLTHLSSQLDCRGIGKNTAWCRQIQKTQDFRAAFAKWYGDHWDTWHARDLTTLENFQISVAETAGRTLAGPVVAQWGSESKSLLLDAAPSKKEEQGPGQAEAAVPALLRNSEELVCLLYLGFIQNVLGRMRTLVMAVLWLFVAATVSIATYPFDPRPTLSGAMLALFLTIGTAVVIVYSQMHRDATLSYVTDTNPGELGTEFWWKLLGFGLGPALGLLATIFPELPGSLFSLLQPGVASIK